MKGREGRYKRWEEECRLTALPPSLPPPRPVPLTKRQGSGKQGGGGEKGF